MFENWLDHTMTAGIAVAFAIAVALVVEVLVRLVARHQSWAAALMATARKPFWLLITTLGLRVGIQASGTESTWFPALAHGLAIVAIGALGWLLIAFVHFIADIAVARNPVDVRDNRQARKLRTQALITRRLAVALIVVVSIGSALLTFDSVRAIGASVLASAGIASIVAGLAAQSVLANMFAGIQLVFSDALRVDDVIVAEGEWGKVGEITLSYVVLDLWDDRRLVLPCTYFTTTPYQNWTRQGSELLGAVEFDLDWRVSPHKMREHLGRVLAETPLFDGRASVLQVTEATGGYVRVRILVTAVDAPTLFDLRCYVREAMVLWIQSVLPDAAPTQRVMVTEQGPTVRRRTMEHAGEGGLFTGSAEAEERASHFTQAMPRIEADLPESDRP